eukprot:NODE_983_length_1633_cov_27.098485_g811_i0.p1 GENE.NODE_983_length_1633_cov_27.098485_g811_i0~~NODE_983_length_1633_cov_27.098485_g811_i0.p1  ORF type:complete len:392 (-),score=74.75 NODE_983_length_1633_cov_27.098485_g811_i0:85-1260(-)
MERQAYEQELLDLRRVELEQSRKIDEQNRQLQQLMTSQTDLDSYRELHDTEVQRLRDELRNANSRAKEERERMEHMEQLINQQNSSIRNLEQASQGQGRATPQAHLSSDAESESRGPAVLQQQGGSGQYSPGRQYNQQAPSSHVQLHSSPLQGPGPSIPADGLALAREQLQGFAQDLGVNTQNLDFDENLTCIVGWDDKFTVLVTYDAATERLFLYSTLLTYLPRDDRVRLKLYEALLEGALLGRDMAGGGVGVSSKNELILLACSIDIRQSYKNALRAIAPVFMDCLVKWRGVVRDVLASFGPHQAPGTQAPPDMHAMGAGGGAPRGSATPQQQQPTGYSGLGSRPPPPRGSFEQQSVLQQRLQQAGQRASARLGKSGAQPASAGGRGWN